MPGTHIPILAPEKIRDARPDYVLILPWNLKEEIIEDGFVHPRMGWPVRGTNSGGESLLKQRIPSFHSRANCHWRVAPHSQGLM